MDYPPSTPHAHRPRDHGRRGRLAGERFVGVRDRFPHPMGWPGSAPPRHLRHARPRRHGRLGQRLRRRHATTTGSRSSLLRRTSSPSGGAPARGTASSAAPSASPPTPRATSTSPTPATTGSRSSTPRELPHQVGKPGSGNGQFNYPNGVATDSSGNVYVADTGNNRIQKFTPRAPSSPSGGAPAPGTASSRPRRRRHRLLGQRLRRRHRQQPDSEVRLLGRFLTKWGSSGSGDGSSTTHRCRHRLRGQRLRRRPRQPSVEKFSTRPATP